MYGLKYIFIVTIVFFSFNNDMKQKAINHKTNSLSSKDSLQANASTNKSKAFKSFDWSKPKLLKEKLIVQLKENNDSTDKKLMSFISNYQKIVNEFDSILNNLSNYDSLNTLAYSPNGKVYQIAKDFRKKVENNGLGLTYSEGILDIAPNGHFLESQILPLLDPVSSEFLKLYCNEIDTACCDDAAVIIPTKKLVNRIYNWGELIDKVSKLKYAKIANNEFSTNLYLLYEGEENTPAFDWKTKKYNQKSLDCMREIIKQHPNSKAAKEFKPFINLLESQNYEQTDKVKKYLSEKFK